MLSSKAQTVPDISDELELILNEMLRYLSEKNQDDPDKRVLVCGRWQNIGPCVDALIAAVDGNPSILSRVIVATKDVSPFISEFYEPTKPQLVEWDEAVYEEYLIERVKRSSDEFKIGVAIDFCPTIRRIRRIRQLLEPDGLLIIPGEGRGWRCTYGDLIHSFSQNGGRYIIMTDCVPSVAERYRMDRITRTPERWSLRQPGQLLLDESIHSSGERSQ